jgi:hypothetical protein
MCLLLVWSVQNSCFNIQFSVDYTPVYVPSRPNNFLAGLKLLNGPLCVVVRLMMCTML